MTRSCPSTLFILFMFPSPGYVRIDKTSLTSRGERIAKSMPIRRGIAGGSRFRPTGWIHKQVWVAGETVAIPTSAICLHMDRDSSSIERDPCPCPAVLAAQSFPGLHISVCIAQRHVQPVAIHLHEEASFFLPPQDSGGLAAAGKARRRNEYSGQVADRLTHRSREGGVSLRSRAFIFWIRVFR